MNNIWKTSDINIFEKYMNDNNDRLVFVVMSLTNDSNIKRDIKEYSLKYKSIKFIYMQIDEQIINERNKYKKYTFNGKKITLIDEDIENYPMIYLLMKGEIITQTPYSLINELFVHDKLKKILKKYKMINLNETYESLYKNFIETIIVKKQLL